MGEGRETGEAYVRAAAELFALPSCGTFLDALDGADRVAHVVDAPPGETVLRLVTRVEKATGAGFTSAAQVDGLANDLGETQFPDFGGRQFCCDHLLQDYTFPADLGCNTGVVLCCDFVRD